jgi:hypothetical protein
MKCSNCGMDNIVEDAVHCPNCGASLLTPGNWDPNRQAPPQQYQQAPAPGPQPQYQGSQQYQAPPQQYSPPQPPKSQRVATVRNIGLTEILFLFSGLFLVVAGFDNLSVLGSRFYGAQYPLLGIIALLAGLFILAMVIMPTLIKGMDNMMDILMAGISLLFLIWGFAATFANNVGFSGGIMIGAALAGLAGVGLRMGMLK